MKLSRSLVLLISSTSDVSAVFGSSIRGGAVEGEHARKLANNATMGEDSTPYNPHSEGRVQHDITVEQINRMPDQGQGGGPSPDGLGQVDMTAHVNGVVDGEIAGSLPPHIEVEPSYVDHNLLLSDTDNANSTSQDGVSLRGARPDRDLASCSGNKRVTMYKFCINGNCDSGANGEHRLRMDGEWLWNGHRNYREGQCHNIGQYTKTVSAWKSLTVGTEEHDTTSENDSWFATMPASQWYSPSCGTYEITLAKQFKAARHKSVCLSTSLSGSYKGAIEASISSESCSRWTQPAESFIWFLKIEPAPSTNSNVGWKTFKNQKGRNYCMDLKWGNTANGNRVQLYHCNGTPAQSWHFDSWGRIHSGINYNKCLEAGKGGGLYSKMFVWDCHSGTHQRWFLQSDGRIRNKAYAKYIGVANGCGGVSSGKSLELHNKIVDGCSSQQRWIF